MIAAYCAQTVPYLGPWDREVSCPVTAKQVDTADRRCRRLAIDATGTQSTARYGGAVHADTYRRSPPACTRCADELEASGVHVGQV